MYMMRRKGRSPAARVLAAVAAVITLGGCATKSDIRDLQTEIAGELRTLAARQDSLMTLLRTEAMSTQDTLRNQSEQIFDFRGGITVQLNAIARSLTTLEALVGENQRGIAGVRDQLANMRRLPTTAQSLPPGTARPGGRGAETIGGVGGSADQLWDVARDQHSRGSYSTAQRAYRDFLAEYPDDARAPDAYFHLGDILTLQDRPEDALEAFQEIQALDPLSPKVPDALYRIARLQIDMGDTEDAKATLQRIIGTYDGTIMARVAQDLLDDIG